MKPERIFEEAEALPEAWWAKFAERLIGMDVEWPLRFADAWEVDPGTIRVAFHFDAPGIQSVVGEVRRQDYPQLERLRAREPLRVRGRIRAVDPTRIELDITELRFCLEPAIA